MKERNVQIKRRIKIVAATAIAVALATLSVAAVAPLVQKAVDGDRPAISISAEQTTNTVLPFVVTQPSDVRP